MAQGSYSIRVNPRARVGAAASGNPCQVCPVREFSVCAALTADELERLNAILTRVTFEPEQAVFYEEDPATAVFNVTSGTLRLSKMLPDGRRQITGFLSPGDFLGIACPGTYAYTAEAITPLSLCRFSRSRLEALFRELPELERRVLSVASNELRAAQDQMLLLGRKTAQEKLATFLRTWVRQDRQPARPGAAIELPMSRTDIADYLGLTTETVSRTFTRLARDGVLELPSIHGVILRRPQRLAELSGGDA